MARPPESVPRKMRPAWCRYGISELQTGAEPYCSGKHRAWRKVVFLARQQMDETKHEEIEALASILALKFPVDRPIWQLSVGEQQRVEIVKTLYRGADIIILDEPTSVLTPGEAEQLFETLRDEAGRVRRLS